MRIKIPKLVISFKSATAAMAMESIIKPELGRIIPLPAAISAGCGLAFCANPEDEKIILELMKKNGIEYTNIHIIELYQSNF